MKKGKLSINAENIFPIIKKWLYSEHDIFIREIISNSNDAIRKHQKLVNLGEAKKPEEDYKITVNFSKKNKTIEIVDNGIGMTQDDVEKYINEIAFSGAIDFIEKYKDKADDKQIIGHFGLGFYSAFMVSKKVEIITKSYLEDEKAVHWISNGETDFEIKNTDYDQRGTKVILHIDDESKEFLDSYKLRQLIKKYFSFLQVEIYFNDLDKIEREKKEAKDEKDEKEENESKEIKPLNNINPLWLKSPNKCTDEEYKEFYKEAFNDYNEPLFWVHINMDYPFHLKGILYFPKLKHEFETIEGQVKLYYNQVYVADNIKEIIPEFLLLLKGTIDCPDLPLNVSRSFLQNSAYVKKISSYITKKVSSSLRDLYKKDREKYNKYWNDISPFVKYGCLRDEKFYDKMKKYIIFKTINEEYKSIDELVENKNEDTTIYYVTDEKIQSQYINMFKENNKEAVILDTMIDSHFISFLESKNNKVSFKRVDSDIAKELENDQNDNSVEISDDKKKEIEDYFKEIKNDENLNVKIQNLKSKNISAVLTVAEHTRRMEDMQKMYGGRTGMMPDMKLPKEQTLVLNQSSNLIQKMFELMDSEDRKEDLNLVANHVYDLAKISQTSLESDEMTAFIKRSNDIMNKMF